MNKEEIMKEIEHIANCELYDTIGVKYLRLNIEKLFEENKKLKEQVDRYKRLIKYLKKLDFYEFELDYDYEENPIDNYYPADMEYHIDNWLANEELESGDNNE